MTELDFDTVRTVTGMAVAPGTTARDYLHGRRDHYVNPVKFAVLAATLYVVVNELTNRSEVAAIVDPLMTMQAVWPYVALLALLPTAFVQRQMFRGRDVNAAECYAFELLLFGELALLATVLLLIGRGLGLPVLVWPVHLPVAAYVAWAVTGLYDDRRFSVWARGAATYLFLVVVMVGVLWGFQWWRFRMLFA